MLAAKQIWLLLLEVEIGLLHCNRVKVESLKYKTAKPLLYTLYRTRNRNVRNGEEVNFEAVFEF